MFNTKVYPQNDSGRNLPSLPSTAESLTSILFTDAKCKGITATQNAEPKFNSAENVNDPKCAVDARPRSATSPSSSKSLVVGETVKSLPELNRGRRINENMAPYERFLMEAEREIARDVAASKEMLNDSDRDSSISPKTSRKERKENKEHELNDDRDDEPDNSLFEANYQVSKSAETVRLSNADLADCETNENTEKKVRNERNREQDYAQNINCWGSRSLFLPPLDIDRPNLVSESTWGKGASDISTACSAGDAVVPTTLLSNDNETSSKESLSKNPELESTRVRENLRTIQSEKDTKKLKNEKTKREEKQIEKETKETIETGEESGQISNSGKGNKSDTGWNQIRSVGKTFDTNASTELQITDVVSLYQPKAQDEASWVNRASKNTELPPLPSRGMKKSPDQILLEYFEKLTTSDDLDDTIDFDFIQSILSLGGCVNVVDEHGQTVLHEVSRAWSVDAAQFFINHGADVNKKDKFGRSPLHVAAAADYVEMMTFLITCGADVEATTTGEEQRPLHYAAKNGAVNCVKLLLSKGANLDSRDFKGRTALQLAAEHKQSITARVLLDEGAPAGVTDDSGTSALVPLIRAMPGVAIKALDQFYTVDRLQQKERYYLNFLDKGYGNDTTLRQSRAQSPLEAVVEQNRLDLIMHPTIQRLIQVKWSYFGRARAWYQLLLNIFLAVVVTTLAVLHPNDVSSYYIPLRQKWWRIVLESFAVLLTFNEIRKEVRDYFQSRKEHRLWKKWKVSNLRRDEQYCHPKWPQEKKFIELEIRSTGFKQRSYLHDKWNFVDWLAYFMLVAAFVLHFMNVTLHLFNTSNLANKGNSTGNQDIHYVKLGQTSKELNDIYLRVISFTLIVIWIRLLKYFRPFHITGPFVVILSHMITATLKWSFVFAAFYIPYTASFWIMFGGRSESPVKGYDTVGDLMFTILQLTLVSDFNFPELAKAAPTTARILCGSFLFVAAIVLLNLFIALMSDTFQRVHDNARATAAIQRAHFIQGLESEASRKTKQKYRNFLRVKCSPHEVELNGKSAEDENDRIQDRLSNLEEQVVDLKDLLIERTFDPENSVVDMMNKRLGDIESILKEFREKSSILSNPRPILTTKYKKKPQDADLQAAGKERGQRRNLSSCKNSKETRKKREDDTITVGKLGKPKKDE